MKNLIVFLVLLFLGLKLFAQKDSLRASKVERTKINYRTYVLYGSKLFAINDSGKVVIWDLNKLDTVHFAGINNSSIHYTAVAKDQKGNIFLGTNKGEIYKVNSADSSCSLYFKDKYTIKYMCFNSANKLFLIVPNAVYNPVTKQHWDQFENHSDGMISIKRVRFFLFFHKSKRVRKYFAIPQYAFLNSDGEWWMIAAYGEFGGDVEIFDTKSEEIINNEFDGIKPGNLSPRSVFEDDHQNIYITCGVQHFMNFGEIYRIDKNRKVVKVFDGQVSPDIVKNKEAFGNSKDFVGPGTYNKIDKHIYFATSSGFYKAEITGDKFKPEFLFNTRFSWNREPLAIGAAMWILKLEFTDDNKLLFLTQNDGFGLYNGKSLVLLK